MNLVPDEESGLASPVSLRPPGDENDESLVIENVLPGRYRVNVTTGLGYVSAITSESTDLLQKPLPLAPVGGKLKLPYATTEPNSKALSILLRPAWPPQFHWAALVGHQISFM